MKELRELVGATGGYAYGARVSTTRPATDYTPRLVAYHKDAVIPLEAPHILWLH
jgi:starch phosphorylase